MLPLLAMLLMQAASPDVVVTADRFAALKLECPREDCAPVQAAKVAIANAEVAFGEGKYVVAKHVLADALSQIGGRAADYPRTVSLLYQAAATVDLHEGDIEAYRNAVNGQVRSVRDHLKPDDPAVLAVATTYGDMWVKLRRSEMADAAYATAERNATAAGQPKIASRAALKRIALAIACKQDAKAGKLLDELDRSEAMADDDIRSAARVMRLRLAAQSGKATDVTRLATATPAPRQTVPGLIVSPPIEDRSIAGLNAENRQFSFFETVRTQSSEVAKIEWMDVGYRIMPDGRTADIQIVRSSPGLPWGELVAQQIRDRRYMARPSTGGDIVADAAGVYRLERITKRYVYDTPIGSLVRRRKAADGYEVLNLLGSS